MTFLNLLVGLPAILLCLVAQVAALFWCVRYYVRQSMSSPGRQVQHMIKSQQDAILAGRDGRGQDA